MHEAHMHGRRQCRSVMGQRHQHLGANRVVLVRHGAGAAAAFDRDLADAVLHHQPDVDAELAQAAADQRQPAGQLRDRIALRMPASRRRREIERLRQPRRDRGPLVPKLVQRAGRTAELHLQQARIQLCQPVEIALQRRAPRRELVVHMDRQGILHPGARHELVCPEPPIELVEPRDDRPQSCGEDRQHRLQTQHQCGVDHVLAGGAEMHVPVVRGTEPVAQLPHELHAHGTVARRGRADGVGIDLDQLQLLDHVPRRLRVDHALGALGLGQRHLEAQHLGDFGLG